MIRDKTHPPARIASALPSLLGLAEVTLAVLAGCMPHGGGAEHPRSGAPTATPVDVPEPERADAQPAPGAAKEETTQEIAEESGEPAPQPTVDPGRSAEAPGAPPAASILLAFHELERAALELDAAGSDCRLACRARDSMRRAADRICELNGDGDPDGRCARARREVSSAERRVARRCRECRE